MQGHSFDLKILANLFIAARLLANEMQDVNRDPTV